MDFQAFEVPVDRLKEFLKAAQGGDYSPEVVHVRPLPESYLCLVTRKMNYPFVNEQLRKFEVQDGRPQ